MEEVKITKTYGRKISIDYDVWQFMTEITRTVKVNNGAELKEEADKLFSAVKTLTDKDIEKVMSEIKSKT